MGKSNSVSDRPYELFFLRSSQRFFIANDNRLLPSGVSPPRFLAFNADGRGVATLVFLVARGEFAPSNAANRSTEPISFLLQVRDYVFVGPRFTPFL